LGRKQIFSTTGKEVELIKLWIPKKYLHWKDETTTTVVDSGARDWKIFASRTVQIGRETGSPCSVVVGLSWLSRVGSTYSVSSVRVDRLYLSQLGSSRPARLQSTSVSRLGSCWSARLLSVKVGSGSARASR